MGTELLIASLKCWLAVHHASVLDLVLTSLGACLFSIKDPKSNEARGSQVASPEDDRLWWCSHFSKQISIKKSPENIQVF